MEGKQIELQYLLAAVLRRAVRNDGAVGVATAHPLAVVALRTNRIWNRSSAPHCPAAIAATTIGLTAAAAAAAAADVAHCVLT